MPSPRQVGEEALEAQNRFHAEELSQKISQLKSVAYDIEVETKEHNRLLDGTGTEFDSAQGFLAGSFNRITKMTSSGRGNRRLMCYVVLFIVGIFVVFYYLAHKITR